MSELPKPKAGATEVPTEQGDAAEIPVAVLKRVGSITNWTRKKIAWPFIRTVGKAIGKGSWWGITQGWYLCRHARESRLDNQYKTVHTQATEQRKHLLRQFDRFQEIVQGNERLISAAAGTGAEQHKALDRCLIEFEEHSRRGGATPALQDAIVQRLLQALDVASRGDLWMDTPDEQHALRTRARTLAANIRAQGIVDLQTIIDVLAGIVQNMGTRVTQAATDKTSVQADRTFRFPYAERCRTAAYQLAAALQTITTSPFWSSKELHVGDGEHIADRAADLHRRIADAHVELGDHEQALSVAITDPQDLCREVRALLGEMAKQLKHREERPANLHPRDLKGH